MCNERMIIYVIYCEVKFFVGFICGFGWLFIFLYNQLFNGWPILFTVRNFISNMADLSFLKPLLKERNIKIKDFCDEIGVTEQGFARLIKNNSTKIETLELIAERLNFPVAAFFEKRGNEVGVMSIGQVAIADVPIIPVCAQAGHLSGFGDMYVDRFPTMPVMVDRTFKGNYRVFEVRGDSMDDGSSGALLSGDKILCREVCREFWNQPMNIKSRYFVIVHRTEGVVVKKILMHSVESGDVLCHSLNPAYSDFMLNLGDVIEMYSVESIASREMRV